jgi:hypothetical protein
MISLCGSTPPVPPSTLHDLGSIAGTNATVMGIVFAVLFVFAAFVFQRLHEKRSAAFDSAYRTTAMTHPSQRTWTGPRET